jgi:hypothetical protein
MFTRASATFLQKKGICFLYKTCVMLSQIASQAEDIRVSEAYGLAKTSPWFIREKVK